MKVPIVVFDFETDGKNPEECNPVEIGALVIDQYSLEPIKGSEFVSNIRPEGIDDPGYLTEARLDTIDWHCKLKNRTRNDLIEEWKTYPRENVVWNLFSKHVDKYNKGGTQYTAPVSAGMNIRKFDNHIVDRLNKKYKISRMFNYEDIDIRDIAFLTLCWDYTLKSRSMDSLRKYFGLDDTNAHTALKDVWDSTSILCRYLKYFKNTFHNKKFRDSMRPE
jgi:DNA polymerase III epsilon subunit-like protein